MGNPIDETVDQYSVIFILHYFAIAGHCSVIMLVGRGDGLQLRRAFDYRSRHPSSTRRLRDKTSPLARK